MIVTKSFDFVNKKKAMRPFLFLSLLILYSFTLSNWHYNRLNRLLNKNEDKCLTVALKIQKWDKYDPIPYLFASVVYLKKIEDSHSIRKKYMLLTKSFRQAEKFEKLSNSEQKEFELWKQNKLNLDTISASLQIELKENHYPDLARAIARNRKKMSFNRVKYEEILIVAENTDNASTNSGSAPSVENKMIGTEFFGMPTGTERIPSYSEAEEQKMLKLINSERKKLGLAPLELEANLVYAARYHSYDMATQNYFDHASYDRLNNKLIKVGKTFDRIKFFYSDRFVNSENIAAGNSDAESTYRQWYNSPGHYKNMFNPSSMKCGIAVCYDPNSTFKYYWTFCSAQ